MSNETNFTEEDEGFWRQFWATTRSHLLTTILSTIIVVQWVLMVTIEDDRRKSVHEVFRTTTAAHMVEMEMLIGEIFKSERENKGLKEENKGLKEEIERLKKELEQRK